MRFGDIVNVKTCQSMPELLGSNGEIVDMQIQQRDKYRTNSVWVKLTSGAGRGKIYGFQENELEMLAPKPFEKTVPKPAAVNEKAVRTGVIEQVERLLKGAVTAAEIAEIEKRLMEARGKIPSETVNGFWQGKVPCWEMFRCPEVIRNECPAFRHRALPCWEIEGTYSKLHAYGEKGDRTGICRYCRVYKKYGDGKPIEIKLVGQGLNRVR